jgi:hypothetical protein
MCEFNCKFDLIKNSKIKNLTEKQIQICTRIGVDVGLKIPSIPLFSTTGHPALSSTAPLVWVKILHNQFAPGAGIG